ncbi:MAG: glycosyltransferase [Nibricoccus sp.]
MSFSPLIGSTATVRNLVAPSLTRTARRSNSRASAKSPAPLIAFCHLSWNGVWQRPQQFLSRLARTRPVLFVETYCSEVAASCSEVHIPAAHPNVTVLEMHLPASRWHDGTFIDLERRRLLREFRAVDGGRFDHPVLWFNDPMAVTAFAGHCGEIAIVYDCMDELSQFKGAPAQLIERERELVKMADVVFCGGRKMREKRLPLNPNTHFYGTGVDCEHFGAARSATLPIHPDIAKLPGKVLGYFGVIDERIDYELLAKLADANPAWSIAMVGPTAKVDPADFPRRQNLHWLGGRSYQELPAITKGFSVCLMPFAINAATEYINPTKALEYMAAGRPVVSTALDEVKSNFSAASRIANSREEFIQQCFEESTKPDATRVRRGIALASQNTWEAIVEKLDAHVLDAIAQSAQETPATLPVRALLNGQLNHV